MFTVVITEKGGAQRRLQFDESEVTIGRVQGNDVVLPKGNVSKRHSRIVLKDNRFIVVDLKSTNGTYVNGRKITSPLVVKEGDKIYIGDFILTLEARKVQDSAPNGATASDSPGAMSAPSVLPPVLGTSTRADGDHTANEDRIALQAEGVRGERRTISQPQPAESLAEDDDTGAKDMDIQVQPAASPPPMSAGKPSDARRSSPAFVPGAPRVPASVQPISPSALPPGLQKDLRIVMERLGERIDLRKTHSKNGANHITHAEAAIEGVIGDMVDQGSLSPSVDRNVLKSAAIREAIGLGPLESLLRDSSVRRVEVTRFDQVHVDRGAGMGLADGVVFSSPAVLGATLQQLASSAGCKDTSGFSSSFELDDGTHVAARWSSPCNGPTAVLSRRPEQVRSLSELKSATVLDGGQAETLATAVAARDNLLIVGPRSADIRSVANALLAELDKNCGVMALEHGADLGPASRVRLGLHWPEQGLLELLTHASGFEVDRWILHDIPCAEAPTLLPLLAARSDGSVCTLFAPSLDAALEELRSNLTSLGDRAEALLAAAFPVVVEVSRRATETRVKNVARLRVEGGRTSAA